MRVAGIGAGGTGKTTLMKDTATKLNVEFHASVNRAVFAQFGHTQITHDKLSDEERWQIQRASFMAKLQQDAMNLPGIYERTTLDHYMYCLIYCHQMIDSKELKKMQQIVINNLNFYDKLFFFPLYDWSYEIPPGQDTFRDNKLANRYLQEHILRGFLATQSHLIIHDVPDLPRRQRLDWLVTNINKINE